MILLDAGKTLLYAGKAGLQSIKTLFQLRLSLKEGLVVLSQLPQRFPQAAISIISRACHASLQIAIVDIVPLLTLKSAAVICRTDQILFPTTNKMPEVHSTPNGLAPACRESGPG